MATEHSLLQFLYQYDSWTGFQCFFYSLNGFSDFLSSVTAAIDVISHNHVIGMIMLYFINDVGFLASDDVWVTSVSSKTGFLYLLAVYI